MSTLLFWAALAIPGYAVVSRYDRQQLQSGLLGTVGLSYLASWALLSPLAIVGYLFQLPLELLSGGCLILIVAGLVFIIRDGGWRRAAELMAGAVSIELLIIAADMFLSARVGAIMGADATLHLARIRFLIDNGLSNADPYVSGGYFFPMYHTNLLHALCAAASQLTMVDHLGVWFASLAWAKLLAACGSYYLAWSVFRSQWPAWIAAIFVIVTQGPVTFMIYPNKLAPFWLLPMMLGLGIQACRAPSWRSAAWLACGAVSLGQLHALYGGFAAILITPVLAVAIVARLRRGPSAVMPLITCIMALCLALPFAWVSKAGRAHQGGDGPSRINEPQLGDDEFISVGQEVFMKNPLRGFGGGGGFRYFWLAAGILCGLISQRRVAVALLIGFLGVAAAILFVPPLCTAAVSVLGGRWILLRLDIVFFLAFATLVPAAGAYLCQRFNPPYRVQAALGLVVIVMAIPYAEHRWPYSWDRYVRHAAFPQSRRLGDTYALRSLRSFLQSSLPGGEVVLVEPHLGTVLAAVYNCYLVAPNQGSIGVPWCEMRRQEARAMLWGGDEVLRHRLLRHHGVRFLFARELPGWADQAEAVGRSKYGGLWMLRPVESPAAKESGPD